MCAALALVALSLSVLPAQRARAEDEAAPTQAPPHITEALGPAHLYGWGVFKYWGFHVYDAYLWVGAGGFSVDQPYSQPFALDIRYARHFKGRDINQTTIDEWERLDLGTEAKRHLWIDELEPLMPDVVEGQHLTGVYLPQGGWRLYSDGKLVGAIADQEFAQAFFAIWLDPHTKAPRLRQQLLSLPAR